MKTTVKTVQDFLTSIDFSSYADAGKITIKGDTVKVEITDVHDDLGQAHEDIAEKFGFEAVEAIFENSTEYLVNVPEKGSFGFVKTYSKHHDVDIFTFVIYNQKYAVAGKRAELKDIIPNFINKVEEALSPHIQSIREAFTINKDELKNETPEQKEKNDSAVEKALSPFVKAMKEKYFGNRQKSKPEVEPKETEDGSGVTFEQLPNGKLVIKQNGIVVGHQGYLLYFFIMTLTK